MSNFTAIQHERTIFAQSTRCPLTLRTNNLLANDANRKTNRCHFSNKQTRRPRLGKQTKHSPISCLFVLMITLDGGGDVLPAGARCAQKSSYVIIAEFFLQLGGELGGHVDHVGRFQWVRVRQVMTLCRLIVFLAVL
jgi:hypothetical protein